MRPLKEGDEVVVLCQICAKHINPTCNYHGRVCGSECHDELYWREIITTTQGKLGNHRGFATYKLRKTP